MRRLWLGKILTIDHMTRWESFTASIVDVPNLFHWYLTTHAIGQSKDNLNTGTTCPFEEFLSLQNRDFNFGAWVCFREVDTELNEYSYIHRENTPTPSQFINSH